MAGQKFDVFLCHNSEDKVAVVEIAKQLRLRGLNPWLDVWELQPGAIWQFALEQQIENIGAVAVFAGQKGMGPWQSEEVYAFLQEFIRRKCPVIPVLLPETQTQPRLPIFLKNRHWVDFRLQEPDPFLHLIWGVTGQKPTNLLGQPILESKEKVGKSLSVDNVDEFLVGTNMEKLVKSIENETPVVQQFQLIDNLASAKGVYYDHLLDLLKNQAWQAADCETNIRMLETVGVGRKEHSMLSDSELIDFPETDLMTVDGLWRKYSRNRFGFSVQKEIYISLGGKCYGEYALDRVWESLGDQIGWRENGKWILPDKVNYNTFSPRGHLPSFKGGGCGYAERFPSFDDDFEPKLPFILLNRNLHF